MPIPSNENLYYAINLYWFLPELPDEREPYINGTCSIKNALEDAITLAIQKNINRVYIPIALGQRYFVDDTIIIKNSPIGYSPLNLQIFGDCPILLQRQYESLNIGFKTPNGYITTTDINNIRNNISIFRIEPTITNSMSGIVEFKGLSFYNNYSWKVDEYTNFSKILDINLNSNQVIEELNFKDCSCFGFENIINNSSLNDFSLNNIKIDTCNINGNKYTVNSNAKIKNILIQDSINEGGKVINSCCVGNVIIRNNMIENNIESIIVKQKDTESVKMFFDDNYIEANGSISVSNGAIVLSNVNNFVINFDVESYDNELILSNQISISTSAVIDFIRLTGSSKIIFRKKFNNNNFYAYFNIQNSYKWENPILLTLYPKADVNAPHKNISILMPGSKLNGLPYFFENDSQSNDKCACSFLPLDGLYRLLPFQNKGNININIGSDIIQNPYGTNINGLKLIKNTISLFTIEPQFDSDISSAYISLSFLIKPENLVYDEFTRITFTIFNYDRSIQIFETNIPAFEYLNDRNWYVLSLTFLYENIDIQNPNLNVELSFQSNKLIASNVKLNICGFGWYVVPGYEIFQFDPINPIEQFKTRVICRPFIPYL